jgi:hypothetical protein
MMQSNTGRPDGRKKRGKRVPGGPFLQRSVSRPVRVPDADTIISLSPDDGDYFLVRGDKLAKATHSLKPPSLKPRSQVGTPSDS